VSVAVYGDAAFVDTRVDLNPVGSEWHNVVQSLYFYGHAVGSVPGTTAADFSAGLAGQRVLVVPELENGDLAASLAPDAQAVIRDFVASGGGLVVHGPTTCPAARPRS
jgi:hypothetical protein